MNTVSIQAADFTSEIGRTSIPKKHEIRVLLLDLNEHFDALRSEPRWSNFAAVWDSLPSHTRRSPDGLRKSTKADEGILQEIARS